MTVQAMAWVLDDAPDLPTHLFATLMGLANHAQKDGTAAYPSQATLAKYARKSERAVRNDLTELERLGLIRRGDQAAVSANVPVDKRPIVWDLAMERKRPKPGPCSYCGRPADMTDHVIPRSRGGTDDPSNLVPSCGPCNSSKRDQTLDEWIASGHAPVTAGGSPLPVAVPTGGSAVRNGRKHSTERAEAQFLDGGKWASDKPKPEPTTNRKGTLAPRARDDTWDAVMVACNVDAQSIPPSARGGYNKAVADLKAVGATPSDIRQRAHNFQLHWPDISLTPTALARRWAEVAEPPRRDYVSRRQRETNAMFDRALTRAREADAREAGGR